MLAIARPAGIVFGEHRPGDPAGIALLAVPDVQGAEGQAPRIRLLGGEGKIAAVGRPVIIVLVEAGIVKRLAHSAAVDVNHQDPGLGVADSDLRAVRRPDRIVDPPIEVFGHLAGRCLARRIAHPELFLTGLVGDVGDAIALRRPGHLALMGGARVRQVPRDAIFHGHGEHVPARRHGQAHTVGAEGIAAHIAGSIHHAGAGQAVIVTDKNLDRCVLSGLDVQ